VGFPRRELEQLLEDAGLLDEAESTVLLPEDLLRAP
jgi:hypothetical protein